MNIVVIDYGSGNLRSAAKAFAHAADEAGIAAEVLVSADPARILAADRLVLPGQGAFADCRAGLDGADGLAEALTEAVTTRGTPFFGICVGMQLLATSGFEHRVTPGLDWIGGRVEALAPSDPALKIPHMGWNALDFEPGRHPVLAGVEPGAHVYFVHSYAMTVDDPAHLLATADYGGRVTAIVGRDNLIGTQFHPEKSQAVGQRLIAGFLRWRP
ncbi:imidazole glycerol phosphate synthase subunit HisH [Tistrella mobilis]|jgi:glutamine amidotransferase|uniref:Imidazole glycerol phosphate synthase subunit HisH n=1 Tax=Tistrella mobilis TaxID=171437 RepID=A0A162LX32_9PROT|nr:imidazole glycerol phosphate synthase subunit HisH [Tistrella mobilis]KYO57461.1 imidazole glycerol phosphate synthase subunit HisH [Tistrella mobilis]MAM76203.1 imidazole glycerol phosphate synthase subunit HisH [Tistrella sp.]